MRRLSFLVSLVLVLAVLLSAAGPSATVEAACSDVIVRDLKIFVDGKEFFVKGMNYSPEPLGWLNMTSGGGAGAGLCSMRPHVFGVSRNACYEEDETDSPWWKAAWERDLPLLKELGTNTLRLYHQNRYNKAYVAKFGASDPNIKNPGAAADHRPFMDAAYADGMRVILPIVEDEAVLSTYDLDKLKNFIEAKIDHLGDHPALLMWTVGNELGLESKPNMLKRVNWCIYQIRQYMKQKWNRRVPVTHFAIDYPPSYQTLVTDLHVDVFTTNAGYRFVNYEPLWDGERGLPGWRELSKKYNKPLLIGEIGMHDNHHWQEAMPDWPNKQWQQIVKQKTSGCIGALYYVYSDSPRKTFDQSQMGFVKYVEKKVNGKSSLDMESGIPDAVVKKPLFTALKSGSPGSPVANYNFGQSVFTLSNTQQATIDVSTCPSYPEDPVPETPSFMYEGETKPVESLEPWPIESKPVIPSESQSSGSVASTLKEESIQQTIMVTVALGGVLVLAMILSIGVVII